MSNNNPNKSAYAQAGVDIDAGNELVSRIKPHVKSTARTGLMGNIGGFGALFDLKETGYKDPILVSGTDGVGTKLKIAIESNIHNTVGIDLVAMCVNDLIVQGAEPLFFLDYFATSKLNVDDGESIISGIAEGCRQANCALIGGETAEMPGMYHNGDYDLAGFVVGAVERDEIITGENIKEGDSIIGITSSGVHSNGYSLIRKIVKDNNLSWNDPSPFEENKTLAQSLLEPTKIYINSILSLVKNNPNKPINGMVHVTGGGFTENLPRVVPESLSCKIDASSWTFPPVFSWAKKYGNINDADMAKTFNCGIGMVIICSPENEELIIKHLTDKKETAYKIGKITSREDSEQAVIIENTDAWK